MKAILILDEMPDNCYDCPLRVYVDCYIKYVCQDILNFDWEETETDVFEIFCKCPLKPMPKKRRVFRDGGVCGPDANYGWNDCIDELVGDYND